MTVLIGSWEFEGPFNQSDELRSEPGLCAILANVNNEFELIEIEETENVRRYIEAHNKYHLSDRMPAENIAIAVYYCSDLTSSLRQGLIEEVLKEFDSEEIFEADRIAEEERAALATA